MPSPMPLPPAAGRLRATVLLPTLLALGCIDATEPPEVVKTTEVGGVVHTLSGEPLPPFQAVVEATGYRSSSAVQADGRFVVDVPAGRSFVLTLRQTGAGKPEYLPSRRRFSAAWLGKDMVVLVLPGEWTVRSGRFSGERVAVSMQRAYMAPRPHMNAPFFGIWDWPEERAEAGGGPSLALSTAVWSDEHLPIPVFFRPDEVARQEPITPADSVLFWTIVEDMEDRLGIDAFRPARKEELAKDSSFTIAGYLLESPRPLTISYAWIPGSNAGDALDA